MPSLKMASNWSEAAKRSPKETVVPLAADAGLSVRVLMTDTTWYDRIRSSDHPSARHPRRRELRSHLHAVPNGDSAGASQASRTRCASKREPATQKKEP